MLSPDEARKSWQITIEASIDLPSLRESLSASSKLNPCLCGLRSVCWKTFLVFGTTDRSKWSTLLKESRDAYTSLREHLLKYINRPHELASNLDPLDDNRNSPWHTLRKDEELRAEILQDVDRCMPEEAFFREDKTQQILLDILFIYCKLNPDVGYRQGMHELLAPILWVVSRDTIDSPPSETTKDKDDDLMFDVLNTNFVEHDTFTLFALVMQSAKSFYELGEPNQQESATILAKQTQPGSAPIVSRSKRIHEHYLAEADPELATHLIEIEILPQIFLIRWIRLLFGREFPFAQVLCLWDTLFAEDAALDLVDLICVAMLLRIRWQLLDADYSTALTLLLKYPAPDAQYGPQTFVTDALFLKEHLDRQHASSLITKYTGRTPSLDKLPQDTSRLSPGKVPSRRRSPLPSPATFIKQQGGVEALLQGAAKGIYARGEKLGVNQAVRDAMDQVQKNMQNFAVPSPRDAVRGSADRWSLDEGEAVPSRRKTMVAMETRNKHLALMLEEALKDLRLLQTLDVADPVTQTSSLDIAVAKIQFVQVYLEDMNMPLPSEESEVSTTIPRIASFHRQHAAPPLRPAQIPLPGEIAAVQNTPDAELKSELQEDRHDLSEATPQSDTTATITQRLPHTPQTRPEAPIPTRSTLAQSSFSWMLESSPSGSSATSSTHANSPSRSTSKQNSRNTANSSKKPISSANREKNAFLFGDDDANLDQLDAARKEWRSSNAVDSDAGFIMGTLRGKSKR